MKPMEKKYLSLRDLKIVSYKGQRERWLVSQEETIDIR